MEYINKKLEDFDEYIRYRKIAIIGLGVSNIPLLDYMYQRKANVTVFDDREQQDIPDKIMDKIMLYKYDFSFGKNCLKKLKNFNIIFRSPSCMPTKKELIEEESRGSIVTTEIEMMMKMCPCKIIGITGSDGKTTTSTLIYTILKENGYNTYLGGNIGTPLFTKLSEIKPDDVVVLELSSFQLMDMKISPNIGVITNITPNHLNIHKDYQEYINAKKNIFKYQNENDIIILNYDNEITRNCAKETISQVEFFSSKTKLENGFIVDEKIIKECRDNIRKHILDTKDIILKGVHNYENVSIALAATKTLVDTEKATETIKKFNGVEHRLEFVKEINGVKWYNDSASSSPTRTISGINAFDEEIILIAGGYDKNLDYTPLAKPILEKVKILLLIGQTSGKIFEAVKQEMENQKKDIKIYMCDTLQETINLANKNAKPGQIVLFSPGSASFDMFKNAYDRGNQFKNLVNKL